MVADDQEWSQGARRCAILTQHVHRTTKPTRIDDHRPMAGSIDFKVSLVYGDIRRVNPR